MLRKALLLLLVVFSLNAAGALARTHADEHLLLSDMVKEADLIFIGRVQQTNSKDVVAHNSFFGVTDGRYRANYTIGVEHVIKGAASFEGRSLSITNAPMVNSYSCPEPGSRGLFLVVSRNDNFAFVAPSHPIFPIAPSSEGKNAAGTDPLASVVQLLTQFLASPGKSMRCNSGISNVDWQKQQVYADIADILKTVPLDMVQSDLRSTVSSSSIPQLQRLLAFDCLMHHNDFDCVDQLKAILSNPPDSSVAPGLVGGATSKHTDITPRGSWVDFAQPRVHYPQQDGMQDHMRSSAGFEPAMEKLTAAIAPLLHSSDLCTRQDVADILSEVATPAVINPLAQIALNDPDEYVRQCAVCGLKKVTAGVGCQKGHPDDGSDREQVDFWRRWAAYKDQSGSPLVVSKLDDVRPSANYTDYLSFSWGTALTTKSAAASDPTSQVLNELAAVLATPAQQIGLKQPPRMSTNLRAGTRTAAVGAIWSPDGKVQSMTLPRSEPRRYDCSGTDLVYADAARQLKGWTDPQMLSSLRNMLNSPALEPQCRLWIASVFVSHGDFQSLEYVEPLLLDPPSEPKYVDPAVRALASSIEWFAGSSDLDQKQQKQRIAILTTLLRSKHVAVRRAAVVALSREPYYPDPTHPSDEFLRTILEPIAKVGLYDPDLEVRWETISALARANPVLYKPGSSQSGFENNQAEGVDFWRRVIGIGALRIP